VGAIQNVLRALALAAAALPIAASADDGYRLWLRYAPLKDPARAQPRTLVVLSKSDSATLDAIRSELLRGFAGMTGTAPPVTENIGPGALVLAKGQDLPALDGPPVDLQSLGPEGFAIREAAWHGKTFTLLTANSDKGLLYGSFRLLEALEQGAPLDRVLMQSAPKIELRVLDHWDNLDHSIERGYAGTSIWDWWKLPDWKAPRYTDYARANASIGINGAVLNNVSGKTSDILTARYIAKVAALADVFRPYGIKVYLAVRFSAPMELDGLPTADPLDPAVRAWWQKKADEIYAAIPDFGGWLIKVNSEGQPGPLDYHRNHAEGANMLADALRPHRGVLMYRAFVYSEHDASDRATQAYKAFQPLDGQFADNVVIQAKNGPIDFQPREPFHPLFGAMPHTNIAPELQITKEYLGFATHLVYLGPLYEELLRSDTFSHGPGSTVAKEIEGRLQARKLTAMAGVSNIGTDRNWSGSIFNQANWYAYGRMAWDPEISARAVAEEWVRMSFTSDPGFVDPVVRMMMGSREAAVDYMAPLGLAHQMGTWFHYGPAPWVSDLERPDWNPTYYAHADATGIGFDRSASGSNALAEYAPDIAAAYARPETTPEQFMLWFHHLGWDARLPSGGTVWNTLVEHYDRGVARVAEMQRVWRGMRPHVDPERYAETEAFLAIQAQEAQWWRDASIAWFQSLSKRPLPAGHAEPPHTLEHYRSITYNFGP
jgi:alpha-glucuronidase